MHEAIRIARSAARFLLLAALMLTSTPALADSDVTDEAPRLDHVVYYDGSSWLAIKSMTGSVEGPGGGMTATARLKGDLGGPKTYFLLTGAASELKIAIARPRFRFASDEGTASRVQLAQFEVKGETRRTTVQIGKGAAVFKRGAELEVTRVSDGLWEARPKKSLQPGEYALILSEADPVADFTIVERGY
ncbi:MAG: hypothetical protein AAB011_13635 [Candidatus Eisenbacteria bacterium]